MKAMQCLQLIAEKGSAILYEMLNPNTKQEEVLLDRKKNLYFIVSMAIDGTSWAEDVEILALSE